VSQPSGKKPGRAAEATVIGQASVVASLQRAKKEPRLEQLQGPGAPQELDLESDETVIGRSDEADVCIDSALISRFHVAFRKNGPEVRFEDLDSSNGVYLNGAKAHSAVLHEGDTVQIGDVVLVFHEGD
jgi:pSer/pThr/pTyr-binding forkhead associated (FHA) protein